MSCGEAKAPRIMGAGAGDGVPGVGDTVGEGAAADGAGVGLSTAD